MAEVLLNELAVLRGVIARPRLGVWHADVVLDTDVPPSGAAVLHTVEDSLRLVGVVQRADVMEGRARVRVVGGANGLGQQLPPRYYRGVPLRVPLADIVRETRESLSATSSQEILDATFAQWIRPATAAAVALDHLLRGLDVAWRILADGTLWVGRESWPNVEAPGDVLEQDVVDRCAILASETLYDLLAPGTTWLNQRVSFVEHTFDGESTRSRVWFEWAPSPAQPITADRPRNGLDALVRHVTRATLLHALFPSTVLAQDDDGTLQVQPDGDVLPPMVGVPIRVAGPGLSLRVAPGARVLVSFESGDPSHPVATLWREEPAKLLHARLHAENTLVFDAATVKLGDAATRGVARMDDVVRAGTLSVTTAPAPGPPGSGSVITFAYTNGAGDPQAPISVAIAGPVTASVLPGATSLALEGRVASASDKVFAE